MGVIDSLSAGFRLLGKRVELVIIPILLDLFLWFTPRLSIAPLLNQISAFYTESASTEGMPENMTELIQQVTDTLALIGESSNLFSFLANGFLLHVPSLVAASGSLAGRSLPPLEVHGTFSTIALLGLFSLLGLLIGVIYLGLLAHAIPIGGKSKLFDWNRFIQSTVHHWIRLILYIALVLLALFIIYIPTSIILGLLLFLIPPVGSIGLFLQTGATMLLFFYLYFVTASLILDSATVKEAITQSFRIVRHNFLASIGFILLTNLITMGLGLLLDQVATSHPIGTLAAIVGNAYIGSGLAMALLIFYRTRLLRMSGEFTGEEYGLVNSNSEISNR